jgi:isoquinoline 1-oxidoreductase subunit beta
MFTEKQIARHMGSSSVGSNSIDLKASESTRPAALARREFLLASALIGSTLVIGCKSSPSAETPKLAPPAPINPFEAYIGIQADGKVLVYSSQFEMGQGVYHGLATLVAEEMQIDVASIGVEGRAGNPALYGNPMMGGAFQLTGGSTSMPGSWARYRKAGAMARSLLLAAASKKLALPVAELAIDQGGILHGISGTRLHFGEVLSEAALLPLDADTPLKAPADWTQIGQAQSFRVDTAAKTNGAQRYTIDIDLPGMLSAAILHSPKFGGKLVSFDAADSLKISGVLEVVKISRGVAVVAENYWAAMQGLAVLKATWDDSNAESRSSAQIFADFDKLANLPGTVAKTAGDASKALKSAAQSISASYHFPYLAHAAMEPLNAVVHKSSDELHIYGGLQMPDMVKGVCAGICAVPPEQVKLFVMQSGGGFGRRAVADCDVFAEAAEIATALKFRAPIKVQWTRENDMRGGRYRPLHVHQVKVGINAAKKVSGWQHHIVGQSILSGTPFEAMLKNGVDESMTEGVHNSPYAIDDFELHITHPTSPIPVLWWRSVGHTHTAYVMETMIDEIAQLTDVDPVALRLQLLPKAARERGVLQLAADKADWANAPAPGRFRGIAVHSSFGSFVATVAEVSKAADGSIKVERCVVASDCGVVINPDIVRAQLEGGTGFGLSAFLGEQLTIENGAAVEGNFDAYKTLRMDAIPIIETHLFASTESPTGIGECAVPTIAPAVANAIFKATGKRIRTLPFLQA